MFLLLLTISFLVSGAEVAYLTLTKGEIEEIKNQESPASRRVLSLISKPRQLLATILITNNFMNVSAILVASYILVTISEGLTLDDQIKKVLEVVLITGVLLLIGEIIPKVYASRNRVALASLLSGVMIRLRWLLGPFARTIISGTQFIEDRFKISGENTSLEDIKTAIDLTVSEEVSKEENEILKGIVNFGNISVRSIMRARTDVVAVEDEASFEDILTIINEHRYSRLPVYQESLDNIKGILHVKDLLPLLKETGAQVNWQHVLREAYFVPDSKKIDSLLDELKKKHLHIAVVVDEFGGTAGIVTLEDIMEEIFGEIMDENDTSDYANSRLDENNFVFEGRMPLQDVRKFIGLDEQEFEEARGESDSLAGLILELYGRIPSKGTTIFYRNYQFKVESVDKNRILQVKLTINDPESNS